MTRIEALDHANRSGEQPRRDAEDDARYHRDRDALQREIRHKSKRMRLATRAQKCRHGIAHKRRNQAIDAGTLVQLADIAHLHAEERASKRRAEHAAERGGGARHQQILVVMGLQLG